MRPMRGFLGALLAFSLVNGSVQVAGGLKSGAYEDIVFEDQNLVMIELLLEPEASFVFIMPGILSVIEGRLTITRLNGDRSTLGPGTTLPIPIEQEHVIKNMTPQPCRVQIILMKKEFTDSTS